MKQWHFDLRTLEFKEVSLDDPELGVGSEARIEDDDWNHTNLVVHERGRLRIYVDPDGLVFHIYTENDDEQS